MIIITFTIIMFLIILIIIIIIIIIAAVPAGDGGKMFRPADGHLHSAKGGAVETGCSGLNDVIY